MKVTIAGTEYKINPTYGHFKKLFKKYDMANLDKLGVDEANNFSLDALWFFLVKRFGLFRPFIFKYRLKYKLSMSELKNFTELIPKLLSGEDGDLGN